MGVDNVAQNMDDFVKRVEKQMLRINNFVGDSFVRNARQTKTYMDITSNLRNSIGFIAKSEDGKIEDFPGGGEGESQGRNYANLLSMQLDGAALIMVAGMSYAGEVEARGLDVISNSVNQARGQYEKIMKRSLNVNNL